MNLQDLAHHIVKENMIKLFNDMDMDDIAFDDPDAMLLTNEEYEILLTNMANIKLRGINLV